MGRVVLWMCVQVGEYQHGYGSCSLFLKPSVYKREEEYILICLNPKIVLHTSAADVLTARLSDKSALFPTSNCCISELCT